MGESIRLRVHRSLLEGGSGYQDYRVAHVEGMSVLDALDYIYEFVDGSLAYYDHAACNQGICKRCLVLIDGSPALMCQTPVQDEMMLRPLPMHDVERDLVMKPRRAQT